MKTYSKSCEDPLSATLPVPEPSDVEHAASIQFDDIKQQLSNLHKDLRGESLNFYNFSIRNYEMVGKR